MMSIWGKEGYSKTEQRKLTEVSLQPVKASKVLPNIVRSFQFSINHPLISCSLPTAIIPIHATARNYQQVLEDSYIDYKNILNTTVHSMQTFTEFNLMLNRMKTVSVSHCGNSIMHINKRYSTSRPLSDFLLLGAYLLRQTTICGYAVLVLVHNQLPRLTQPTTLSRMENEYWPRGSGSAFHLTVAMHIHLWDQWPKKER